MVDTLLASYRPSSQRQQEVAWTVFRRWLPLDRSTVTKDDVLAFLQYLFSSKSLAPNTILNYRAALQWPLEEAFSVNFSQPDFTSFATGLFHLRPPIAPVIPQWDLSAVIRFHEQVDPHTCSFRLLLLKTLCLTALASGNRCSELAHISRRSMWTRALLLRCPSSHVFYLKTRRLLAVLPLFLSLPFLILPSALSRPSAFFSVAPPHGTTGTSSLLIPCPMPLLSPAESITGSSMLFWRQMWVTPWCGRMTFGNSRLALIGLAGRTCLI